MADGASRGSRPQCVSWSTLAMAPGVAALAAGAALDLAYHVGLGETIGLVAALAGDDGESAHWILFVGMALVVAGLVAIGAQTTRHTRRLRDSSESIRSSSTESVGRVPRDRKHSFTGG